MGNDGKATGDIVGTGEAKTFDITPTWAAVLPLLIDVVKKQYTLEAVATAREELVKMGTVADKYYDAELMWTANEGSKPKAEPAFSWADNVKIYREVLQRSEVYPEEVVKLVENNMRKIARAADKYNEYVKQRESEKSKGQAKDAGVER